MPSYTPAELQTISDSEGWHTVCGPHVAVVTGRKSVFVYRKRHGKFDTDHAIVLTRLEAADLFEVLRRPAVEDFDGSALWNETAEGAVVDSPACHRCGNTAHLADPDEAENWDLIHEEHYFCERRDPKEPDNPDFEWEDTAP